MDDAVVRDMLEEALFNDIIEDKKFMKKIIAWISDNMYPEQVFSEEDLNAWETRTSEETLIEDMI